ncbi:MAG: bifunctional (p)ppGpp synthetase/guanosine-3',5'-bis(diphosphate) 3'-pyrophosphohydrolase [Spirochaetaceae bacterium]|nr:MAG: bifunctional (p)ppGpp synthetase/guanosine-3',5'-bis(diphosphate) 3'-pyrophosphohydrolase [Spirochaetaceae bacterium]
MQELLTSFEQVIHSYSEDQQERILAAAKYSADLHEGQIRNSGDAYITHPIAVAEILISLNLDSDAIIAALLHDVLEDTKIEQNELRDRFGKDVEQLVQGVTKIATVKAKNRNLQAAETIRKMLLAMVKDIRVILIKLADKLHNMRTLEFKNNARRRAIALECLDIYAPLAGRLGISWLKDELEDLSLKHLHPDTYHQIKDFVSEKRSERADYLERVQQAIEAAAEKERIPVFVDTRAKHFYSIYEKMRKRGKSLDEIYDLLGIRLLCETETQCYTLLGIVHRLWMPIEGRFKDYIAMPKSNRYQSLHTTVMCYGGRRTEIQIRTHDMHRTAEFGVAAHWMYKTSPQDRSSRTGDLAIISHVRSLGGVRINSNEFLDEIKREILRDSIYVFTPQGDVVQLPRGATPLDFAYHIHSEIGNRCVGAKADGQIVPLKEPLGNTQIVEILTSNSAHPHLNWLRYVKTTRARHKIRHWLNKHDENLIIDQSVVAKRRDQTPRTSTTPTKLVVKDEEPETPASIRDTEKVGVRIGKERNWMIRFANCCRPETGDEIVGYISRGRGIIVHKTSCPNLAHIPDYEERRIDVEWETISPHVTRRFRVTTSTSRDLFSEIEGAVRKYHGHLIEGRVDDMINGKVQAHFTLEMERATDTKAIMKNIRMIPSVLNIYEDDTYRA